MVWNFAMTNKNQKQMTRSNPPGTKCEVSRLCCFYKYFYIYFIYKYNPFGTKSEVSRFCCFYKFLRLQVCFK